MQKKPESEWRLNRINLHDGALKHLHKNILKIIESSSCSEIDKEDQRIRLQDGVERIAYVLEEERRFAEYLC